jgi:peptide chain release factor subunit 1
MPSYIETMEIINLRQLAEARLPELGLSLYLPAGPALDGRYYVAMLKDMVRSQEESLDERSKAALQRECRRARAFLEENSLPGKPFALFSSEPADLFEAFWLPEDVKAELAVGERLLMDQVAQQAQRHPPAYVVLVDKEESRVFATSLGRVSEIADLKGDPIKRHKQGGWSDDKFQRHEDLHVTWNFKAVAEWLERRDPNGSLALYLAGPAEDRARFQEYLPKALRMAVRKEFAAPMYLTTGEMEERLKAVA